MDAVTTTGSLGKISLATVVGWIPLVAVLWFFGKPFLIGEMEVAMAGEIQDSVTDSVQPIHGALKVLINRDINTIRVAIAELEYKRENATEDNPWTRQDRRDLVSLRQELEAFSKADDALVVKDGP